MRIRSAFLFSFLLVSCVAHSAYAGPLSGRVVDPDGRPVAGARVLLVGTGLTGSTLTNARGEFTLTAPDRGRYEVRVALDGFRADPIPLEATTAGRDLGTLSLSVSAISETLVVSASQVEIPLSQASSSITVISGEELRSRQITTIADALRGVAGLTVLRAGGTGSLTTVFPRGGESDYTLVYIDGIQANAFGGGFDFAHLAPASVERVEVVSGPQSALYGSNGIGAVVRIVTREAGPLRGDASLEGGSFGTARLSANTSGSARRWFWGAGVDRLRSDGRNGDRTEAGEAIGNDDYERTQTNATGGWRNDAGASVRTQVQFSRDARGFPGPFGSNPIGVFPGVDLVSHGSNDRWGASIGGSAPAGGRVRTRGLVAWNAIDSDFVSGFGASNSSSRRVAARGQADIALATGLDVSAGAEFQRERATSSYITDNSGPIPIERSVGGYFVEARLVSANRLFVNAGLRIEDIHRDPVGALDNPGSPRPAMAADDVVSFNPKVSAAFYLRSAAGSETKIRGSAGTGIRPPDSFELAFTDNPSLKPERSRSVEAGIDQAFASGHGSIEATWFHNTFDDLIVAVGRFVESSRYRTDNISNARARGMEVGVTTRARGAGADVQARVTYTFLDTEVRAVDRSSDAPPPFTVGQPLLNRPRHAWSVDAGLSRGKASAWVRGGGRGRVLAVEPSYGTFGGLFDAAGYSVWNAGAAWRVSRQIEIFGRVENLFDRRYEEIYGFPALGRGAVAGLRIAASR